MPATGPGRLSRSLLGAGVLALGLAAPAGAATPTEVRVTCPALGFTTYPLAVSAKVTGLAGAGNDAMRWRFVHPDGSEVAKPAFTNEHGTATQSTIPADGGTWTVHVEYLGDGARDASSAVCRVPVQGAVRTEHTIAVEPCPDTSLIGNDGGGGTTLTGSLTPPPPGASVQLRYGPPSVGTSGALNMGVPIGPDGSFAFELEFPRDWRGSGTYTVSYPGDTGRRPASRTCDFTLVPVGGPRAARPRGPGTPRGLGAMP